MLYVTLNMAKNHFLCNRRVSCFTTISQKNHKKHYL